MTRYLLNILAEKGGERMFLGKIETQVKENKIKRDLILGNYLKI